MASPTKTRYKISRKSTSKNIGTHPYYCSSIKHRIDTTFTVITHQKPTKLQSCFGKIFGLIIPKTHLRIVVFKVRSVCICTQITPFTNHRITQKSIMSFITIAKKYSIIDLTPNFGIWANGGWAINFCSHFKHRIFT